MLLACCNLVAHPVGRTLNISLSLDSIEMPLGYHHCINFVTNMAYRSSGFGRTLLQHIIGHAPDYGFKGRGLCVRVDLPLIPVFIRLHSNFVHQYQYDQFFPATDVQLPAGCRIPGFSINNLFARAMKSNC
jgi:GNAT superfamily N-acetyltransferase